MIIRTAGMWYFVMHVRKRSSEREVTNQHVDRLLGGCTTH